MTPSRQCREDEIHDANVRANTTKQNIDNLVRIDQIDDRVPFIRPDRPNEVVDAVFTNQPRVRVPLQPFQFNDELFFARTKLTTRRIRRLRLARLMRIEKGENRLSNHGKASGKLVRLRDHTAHLLVFQRRSEITVSDGRETFKFIDNDQTCAPAVGCKRELFIRDRRCLADVPYKLIHCALRICEPREYLLFALHHTPPAIGSTS